MNRSSTTAASSLPSLSPASSTTRSSPWWTPSSGCSSSWAMAVGVMHDLFVSVVQGLRLVRHHAGSLTRVPPRCQQQRSRRPRGARFSISMPPCCAPPGPSAHTTLDTTSFERPRTPFGLCRRVSSPSPSSQLTHIGNHPGRARHSEAAEYVRQCRKGPHRPPSKCCRQPVVRRMEVVS